MSSNACCPLNHFPACSQSALSSKPGPCRLPVTTCPLPNSGFDTLTIRLRSLLQVVFAIGRCVVTLALALQQYLASHLLELRWCQVVHDVERRRRTAEASVEQDLARAH